MKHFAQELIFVQDHSTNGCDLDAEGIVKSTQYLVHQPYQLSKTGILERRDQVRLLSRHASLRYGYELDFHPMTKMELLLLQRESQSFL